ncbi:MAG: hypothetical protein JXM70_30525 [Pirellulales bacterium]|nr:hypothetical protein [Pirellulales bacterium]
MRKSVLYVLIISLFLGATAVAPAVAGDAKPLVVMSLADYDGLVADASSLKNIAQVEKMPVWLQSMLRLYIEGGTLTSLDSSRPWGAVVQIDDADKLSGYCFLPVTDPEGLLIDLSDFIEGSSDVGNGIYRIDSATDDKFLYAKITDKGWIIAGDDVDVLAGAPDDPSKLIKGLNKKFDFAMQLNICNIPDHHGAAAMDKIKSQLNDQFSVDTVVPEKTRKAVYEAIEHLDQVILGWSRHK